MRNIQPAYSGTGNILNLTINLDTIVGQTNPGEGKQPKNKVADTTKFEKLVSPSGKTYWLMMQLVESK